MLLPEQKRYHQNYSPSSIRLPEHILFRLHRRSTLPPYLYPVWNASLVGMGKEPLPAGVLGTGGTNSKGSTGMGLARWGGQHMTWYDTFGAMEQPPTELMILLRNWDNFDLNEYFPITLK